MSSAKITKYSPILSAQKLSKTSGGRVNRLRPRQGDDRLQSRPVVLEPQLTAMQPRHRRREAQPQPGARLRAALLQSHEAIDDASAIRRRNSRSTVAHREQDAITVAVGAHHDVRRGAV